MPFDREQYQLALRAIAAKNLVVYGPRVLILRDKEDTVTKGGLYVPDEAQRKKKTGTVVALGQGYEEASSDEYVAGIKIGHQVAFNSYDGILQTLETSEGPVEVIVLHVGNLYLGWPNKEV